MHWCEHETRLLCWLFGFVGAAGGIVLAYARAWWPVVKRFFGGASDA